MMVHPINALLYAALCMVILLAIFWPGRGLFWRWKLLMRQSQRAYMEDALKHIFECQQSRIPCTLNSIAGTLGLKKDRVTKLVQQLKHSGFIHIGNQVFTLSEKGKEYALRMIRLHRIWESYLALETGTSELDWHEQADRQEHKLDVEKIEKLSEQLGHPRYDPHGEPIPTMEGQIPSDRGCLLTELQEHQFGKIIQFEDDPVNIYREIRENGLCLGMQIDSVHLVNGSALFKADGHKKTLSLIAAAQIRLEPLHINERLEVPLASLVDLKTGESGRVIRISREIRGQGRRRLLDLGIVPGTVVTKEMESASGNPIAYEIRGATIALRQDQARLVHIEKIEKN